MKTMDAARGRWREILAAFGIDPMFLDGKHKKCPVSGEGEDRFRFSDQNGSGDYFCACSQGGKGGFGLLTCKTGKGFKELAPEVDAILNNKHEAEPRKETHAEHLRKRAKQTERSAYLGSRGLEVAPGLRWATDVEYWHDNAMTGKYSAMLAPVTRNGEWLTYHVTYLEKGKKADVPSPRKILPGPPIAGAGIELYPAAEEMGVAEGIETAIAAKMLYDTPTHSAINTSMLAKWEPPAIAKVIYIFADNDKNWAGHSGAYHLAHRLALKGLEVHIMLPPEIGDWNDVLLSKKAAA